jgi:hypothetical protein
MIWLTWRQFRVQAAVAAAFLAVTAVALALTGAHVHHLYTASGLATCQARNDCTFLAGRFATELRSSSDVLLFDFGVAALYIAPALIGVFWGAPLITRELETGTFRLAWNQSVTRTRWLAVKLAGVGLAAMATAGLLSLMISWWSSPVYQAARYGGPGSLNTNQFQPPVFGAHGVVPIGYAAFAFVLGAAIGVLVKRTVPAMAVTLGAFATIQVAMPAWIRPHLITPVRVITALNPNNLDGLMTGSDGQMTVLGHVDLPGAWVLSNQSIDTAGRVFTGPAPRACLSQTASFQACQNSIGGLHLRQLVTYQPASRFWEFQWYETAIFLVLALALAGFCFWRLGRRRLT